MDSDELVTLHNLAGGAAAELFGVELERVVADILDVNTEAEAVREITVKVKIKPDENRNFAQVAVTVASKLGTPRGVGTMIFLGKQAGRPVAIENNPDQRDLFPKQKPAPFPAGG
jgi:hypothetical protein